MKLGQKAIATLEEWGAFTEDRRRLTVEGDKCSMVGEVTAANHLSCSLSFLRLEPRTLLATVADDERDQ